MKAYAPNPQLEPRQNPRRGFALKRLAQALAASSMLSLGLPPVQAAPPTLPSGLSVIAGQAQVSVNGSQMTVTNSSQAILNWSSFSIGQGSAVYFQQPSAASQVLNRVTGADPTTILGNLGSNGKVWLLNPNGVLFGASARVDVAGMVASTLRMSDLDWTAGKFRLAAGAQDAASAAVHNAGEIRTAQGGTLALIAGTVGNAGLMRAPGGQVMLAAGQSVELVDTGTANLSVRVTAAGGVARNLGMLEAAGGRIDITAAAVNQDGIVRADALGSGSGGEIWIRASQGIDLAKGSETSASGGRGGEVLLHSDGGRTTVQGTVSARGTESAGGEVVVLGPEIGLLDDASIDVSGASGGGRVYVGGGAAGKDPRFVNSRALYVDSQAQINADATLLGDGGQVFLWSDTATRAYGSFSARGGSRGGRGGFIETSGGWLDARPSAVDTRAPLGLPGEWLLDPYDILITDSALDTLGPGPVFTAGGSGSTINSLTIAAGLANGNNVTISTGGANGGTEAGTITLRDAKIDVAVFVSARPGGLTLLADSGINMLNSSITSSIGAMPVTFLAAQSGNGGISLTNSTITTGIGNSHGAIVLSGGAVGTTPSGTSFSGAGGATANGVSVVNSQLNAGGASVTLQGVSTAATGVGVQLDASSRIAGGNLSITGDGNAYRGVDIQGNLASAAALRLLGRGDDVGIRMNNANATATGRVEFTAASVDLSGNTRISSTAAGDAILIADATGPLARFINTAGTQVLSVEGASGQAASGRWIVYATDIKDAADFQPGGLVPAFRRYGGSYGAWLGDVGNGLVFSTNEVATVSGQVNTKVYDGNTNATLATVSVSTSVGGDVATVVDSSASFATKNVGTGISVGLNGGQAISARSADGAAVFGYTLVSRLSGDITPATLTVAGLSANNKIYDATTTATLRGIASVVPLGSDVVSIGGQAVASFTDKNVGTSKPVVVSGLTLSGADAGNYLLAPLSGLTANITPAALTLLGLRANNKIYDATTAATLTGVASIAPLGGDRVSLSGQAAASFFDKNVGTGKPVSVTGLSLSGADAGNYTLAGLSANITPATLTVSGLSANNKIYDATAAATLNGVASIAPLANDVVLLSGQAVASFVDKNVGTAKPVFVGGLGLSGADASNYVLAPPVGFSANITPATLDLSGLGVNNKTYDATTAATLNGLASIVPLGNDVVTLSGQAVASFSDKNVGTAKPVSVSGLALSGADAANYVVAPPSGLRANITPAALTLSGLSVDNKIYDATTVATLNGVASIAPLGNDLVSLSGQAVANFADKNVGTAKPVVVSGLSLSGADAANYFAAPLSGLRGNITPATLELSGLSVTNKTYDATTAATLNGLASIVPLGNDVVTLSGQAVANFSDKNVGMAKPVSVSGLVLSGADAANYRLVPAAALSASITPATLNLGGLRANDKVYDASNAATLNGVATFQPLGNDVISLSGQAIANFADKNVGTAKPVSVSGLTLSGADAANYTLAAPSGLSASITPATVTLAGLTAGTKVYDGTRSAPLVGSASVNNVAPGDSLSLLGTPNANFVDANVGTSKAVTVSGLTLTGADALNYNLVLPNGLTGNIEPARLTYVAEPVVVRVGAPITGLQGSVVGFVGGDTLATATTGIAVFSTPSEALSTPGSYPVFGSGLSATNYTFAQAPGNLLALSIVGLEGPASSSLDNRRSLLSLPLIQSPQRGDEGGLVNLLVGPAFDASSAPNGNFGSTLMGALSPAGVTQLLSGRDRFKEQLLADARSQLERNPDLANLRQCPSLEEAQQGKCLINESLKLRSEQQRILLANARSRLDPLPDITTASLDDLPPTAAGPAAASPTPTPAPTPLPAQAQAPEAAAVPSPGPELLALARPTQRALELPAIDPLQAQLDLLLANYKVKTAVLPQIERKIAIVIGVDEYADSAIPRLGNAVRDAKAVAKMFESRLGYEPIVLENATRATLVGALNRLALTMAPQDSVVVYYAGHGELVEATGQGYWLLSDSSAKDPTTWLSNSDISRLVGQIGAHQVALVSDSCYSGTLASGDRIRAKPLAPDPREVLSRKTVVVMTSGGNEPVFDEGRDGHSLFAWNLLNVLGKVDQWQPGGNVFERIRFEVARALPQRPQYSSSRSGGSQPGGDFLYEYRQLEAAK